MKKVTNNNFSMSIFLMYLLVLFGMAAIHTGVVVLIVEMEWNPVFSILFPVGYWTMAAIGLTCYTRKRVREDFEKPIEELSEATNKVARGDFSVYVPTIHTADKLDYRDRMIMDFNKMIEELGSIETLKTDFVSNVSHEMKTPLVIIKGYVCLLQEGNLTKEEHDEFLEVIDYASTK